MVVSFSIVYFCKEKARFWEQVPTILQLVIVEESLVIKLSFIYERFVFCSTNPSCWNYLRRMVICVIKNKCYKMKSLQSQSQLEHYEIMLLTDFLLIFATLSYYRFRSNSNINQWFLANDLAGELSYYCYASQPGWTRKGKFLII